MLADVRLDRTCDLCGTDGHTTKIMFCNTCKLACYCSEACRVAALPEHKDACLAEVERRREERAEAEAEAEEGGVGGGGASGSGDGASGSGT